MTRYSLYVLKVPLNTKQTNKYCNVSGLREGMHSTEGHSCC